MHNNIFRQFFVNKKSVIAHVYPQLEEKHPAVIFQQDEALSVDIRVYIGESFPSRLMVGTA